MRGLLGVVLVLLGAACCQGEAINATPADTQRARALCASKPDFKASEGAQVLKSFEAYCSASSDRCASRQKIAEVCSFYGSRTSQRYEVHTTLRKGDSLARERLCEDLRASKSVGLTPEVLIYCADSPNWCMRCAQGSGEHR